MSRSIRKKIIALSISGTTILTGLPMTSMAEELGSTPIINEENKDVVSIGEQKKDGQGKIEATTSSEEENQNSEQVEQSSVQEASEKEQEEQSRIQEAPEKEQDVQKEEQEAPEKEQVDQNEQQEQDEEKVTEDQQTIEVPSISIESEPIEYSLENYWTETAVRSGRRMLKSINKTDYTNFKSQIESDEIALAAYNKMIEIWVEADTITGGEVRIVEKEEVLDDYMVHDPETGNRTAVNNTDRQAYLKSMKNSVTKALAAFLADYPEVSWIDVSKMSTITGTDDLGEVSVIPNSSDTLTFYCSYDTTTAYKPCYDSYSQVNTVRASLKSAVETIANSTEIEDAEDSAAKIKVINDYIVKLVNYNTDAASDMTNNPHSKAYCNAWTAVGAYVDGMVTSTSDDSDGKVVCEGYSKAFKLVCDNIGIPCILVSGDAYNNPAIPTQKGAHMWNYVKVDDTWYLVDVTWNDANDNEVSTDKYLLVGTAQSADHVPGNTLGISTSDYTPTFTYPTLSSEKYVVPSQLDKNTAAVTTAKVAVEGATYTAAQADVTSEEAAKTAVESKLTSLGLEAGINTEVTKVSYTAPVAGTKENVSGTAGSYKFTVAISKGSDEDKATVTTTTLTMPITATAYVETEKDKNTAAVTTAKAAVEGATYTAAQADVTSEEAAKTAVESKLTSLGLEAGINTEVTKVSYTAPVAGTKENVSGTAGSYKFTVAISKGSDEDKATVTTTTLTMPITATAYVETEKDKNTAAVTTAKAAVEGATYTAAQADVTSEEAAKTAVESKLTSLGLEAGINTEVTKVSYTAPVAGTKENVSGTAGSYKFTVAISKGSDEDKATVTTTTLTMPITATAYVETEKDKNTAAVTTAKAAVEGATYTAAQADVTSEEAAKTAVESKLTSLGLEAGINTEVTKVSYTAPVAGTKENVSGTAGSYKFTVAISKGSDEDKATVTTTTLTMPITATAYVETEKDKNTAAVTTAKAAVEGATYTAAQADVTSEEAAKTAVESKLTSLGLEAGINTEVTKVSYTAPVAGTKENVSGTAGSYKFTVEIGKGSGEDKASVTTTTLTMTISASAYVESQQEKNQALVNTNKEIVEAASYVTTYNTAIDETKAKKAVEDILDTLNLSVKAEVVNGTYTAPIDGTEENINGTAGSYTFVVALSKGSDADLVSVFTKTITLNISAKAYTETEKYKNIVAIEEAEKKIEAVIYSISQSKAKDEATVQKAIEDILSGLKLDVNTKLLKVSYVAAIAGTKNNKQGTDGSYVFSVELNKGLEEDNACKTTKQLTMLINAKRYVAPSSSDSSSSSSSNTNASTSTSSNTNNKDTSETKKETEVAKVEKKAETNVIKSNTDGSVKIVADQVADLIVEDKPVVVKNDSAEIKMSNKVLGQVINGSSDTKEVTLKLEKIEKNKVETIQQKVTQTGDFTSVSTTDNNWISLQTNAQITSTTFKEPVVLTVKLDDVKDVPMNKLTLVKYVENEKGETKVIKLGGNFDATTNSFSGYITSDGNYGVMVAKDLKQIQLQIGNKDSKVDGSELKNDVAPEIINDVTVVPIRFIAESLGAEVKWDSVNKRAVITLEGKTVIVSQEEGSVNRNGRILVPLRYIAENLDANVLWIPDSKEIQIVR